MVSHHSIHPVLSYHFSILMDFLHSILSVVFHHCILISQDIILYLRYPITYILLVLSHHSHQSVLRVQNKNFAALTVVSQEICRVVVSHYSILSAVISQILYTLLEDSHCSFPLFKVPIFNCFSKHAVKKTCRNSSSSDLENGGAPPNLVVEVEPCRFHTMFDCPFCQHRSLLGFFFSAGFYYSIVLVFQKTACKHDPIIIGSNPNIVHNFSSNP
jgi:hypothetical protein